MKINRTFQKRNIRYFSLLLSISFLLSDYIYSQDLYIVNSDNEIKVVDLDTYEVQDLFTVDPIEFGILNDLAFSPNGLLFGVTSSWKLVEIDILTGTTTQIFDLPIGGGYTSLVCSVENELYTSRISPPKLYKFNLDTNQIDQVIENISTPGDFTFYKGNLVYPNIANDVIIGFDGSNFTDIGCSMPLIFTFVNDFVNCENNSIYAFDLSANLYLFDLETENVELLINLSSDLGQVNGGATKTEYLASACPLESLELVICNPLGYQKFNLYGITLKSNPVEDMIEFEMTNLMDLDFSLINAEGKLVMEGSVDDNCISTYRLDSGIYFLKMINNVGLKVFEGKIIKK
jgi:hypothetical protein